MPLPEKLRLQHFLRRFHRPLVRVEDFAETFMVYLRSKGTLPECFSTPSIRRNWKFIRDLGRVVASGGSKW